MTVRKEYFLKITINNRNLSRVVIDQHYQLKHPEMSDDLILELVKSINKEIFEIESETNGFQYFRVEPVMHNDKPYRLVLLLCIHDDLLGVVNAFRIKKGKSYD